ncbi:LysM peptidoglycan-binding domain-containing protein [Candidimonas sp. SYP-B2681]|uniref:transglycosylase SLT domain-containing protein n=1 Tax=Candidimonas sp. SYP-B2681 TaxID=2497686 RepID=UPI000F87338B|nr:transglycosylase SLT domain-containing protein [Candidimonas sp. SYP-B2681]RTZ39970.1 LysM peptidoglycan-binding domain-containing protein [Candidimonas sp. SYP-B2681]
MNCLRLFILLIVAVLAGCATNTSQNPYAPAKKFYTAAETSRTIDLTHPPRDMWDRVRRGFAIPNLDNELTARWTEYYASHPESVLLMSKRAGKYLYYIVDELNRRGLPTELALLPFVESAYNPTAYSRAKASGLWQFIPSTGLHYNLQQDAWRDQRRDPVASTHAALDYLAYLYDFQGDWYLALASYNWGEGSVKRAMEKNAAAGIPADYAALKMPEETRNYVPKLQAIKNIITNPKKYGITLPEVSNTPYFTKVQKTDDIDIEVAAKLAEMPLDEFKLLNASFNRPIILAEHQPALLLPLNRVDIFNANLEAYKGRLSAWRTYKSQPGESYVDIAKQYGISTAQLRAINGLGSKATKAVAQTLLVPAEGMQGSIQLASLQVSESQTDAPRSTPSRGNKDVVVMRRKANVRTHTVKGGDTLFSLAKQYNTSVNELRKLNNLKDSKLSKGDRLRVPGTSIRG